MFAGSHEGAERAAMMYSFLGICKKKYKLLHLAKRYSGTYPGT
jgi:hypothetical protein